MIEIKKMTDEDGYSIALDNTHFEWISNEDFDSLVSQLQDLLKRRRGEVCEKCKRNYAAICVCEPKAVEPPEKPQKASEWIRDRALGILAVKPYKGCEAWRDAIIDYLDHLHKE